LVTLPARWNPNTWVLWKGEHKLHDTAAVQSH